MLLIAWSGTTAVRCCIVNALQGRSATIGSDDDDGTVAKTPAATLVVAPSAIVKQWVHEVAVVPLLPAFLAESTHKFTDINMCCSWKPTPLPLRWLCTRYGTSSIEAGPETLRTKQAS